MFLRIMRFRIEDTFELVRSHLAFGNPTRLTHKA